MANNSTETMGNNRPNRDQLIHDRYYWVNDPQRTEPVVMRFTRAGNERGTLRAWMHAIDEHRFDEIEIQGPLEIPFDE